MGYTNPLAQVKYKKASEGFEIYETDKIEFAIFLLEKEYECCEETWDQENLAKRFILFAFPTNNIKEFEDLYNDFYAGKTFVEPRKYNAIRKEIFERSPRSASR